MRINSLAVGAALYTLCLLIFARNGYAESESESTAGVQLSKNEQRLVKAINEYREEHDLAPLQVDRTLMHIARYAAPHFNHVVDGKWSWQRAHQAGFRGWATDDIADGYLTPEDAVQGWSTSDGHARQMRGYFKMNGRWCNYRFNRVGVGVSGRKYIAVFGCDCPRDEDEDSSDESRS